MSELVTLTGHKLSLRFPLPLLGADIRQCWIQSKTYRRLLVAALIYLCLRLVVQAIVVSQVVSAGPIASETTLISNDLQIYMAAAQRLQQHQDLYLQEALDRIAVFQYAPAYALLLTAFLDVPFGVLSVMHTFLNIACYILLYLWWGRIFQRLGQLQARAMLAWTLPVWFIFAAFWGDLAYLNIYVITTLICTLLIEAVLTERLGWALLWISVLLQTKPYLAFPLVILLLLGRWRFFFTLAGLTIAAYLAIVGLTILAVGPAYGWEQHLDYLRFLAEMTRNFPWRGPDQAYLGYNHSILQIMFYYLGISPGILRLAIAIKIVLLLPLALVSLLHMLWPARSSGREASRLSLDLAFALYTGALIWLDIVWEVTLGIVVFAYLLATVEQPRLKTWLGAVFIPYALLDVWQVLTFVILGPDIIAPDVYIWTDPSIYFPMTMVVILTFYIVLVKRLWSVTADTPTGLPTGS